MTLIGIIGGGQLGRMLALAGYPLGLRFRFFDPSTDCSAGQLSPCVVGDFNDQGALRRFCAGLDLVTYEFENIPIEMLGAMSEIAPIHPPRTALAVSQDRLQEKQFFQKLGIQTTKFAGVSTKPELDAAISYIGFPGVVKTRRFGYDGKGQYVLRSPEEASQAWEALKGQPCIYEEMIDFDEEVSIIAARAPNGEIALYPLAHNTHRKGILRVSWCDPTAEGGLVEIAARKAITTIVQQLDYVGVLALELFVRNGIIVANEMAPRVHNSGHWSIEGSTCSQFENHLRAILDLPLGHTGGEAPCAMVNLIGKLPDLSNILRDIPNAHVHFYGKEVRPGRKVGHITVLASDMDLLQEQIAKLQALVD